MIDFGFLKDDNGGHVSDNNCCKNYNFIHDNYKLTIDWSRLSCIVVQLRNPQ